MLADPALLGTGVRLRWGRCAAASKKIRAGGLGWSTPTGGPAISARSARISRPSVSSADTERWWTIFPAADGQLLDQHATYIVAAYAARAAR
jgi:hypothetical protein